MAKYKPYRFFLYLLLEAGQRLFLILPRPAAQMLACGIGRVVFWILPKERSKTLRHLREAFGGEKTEHEISKIAGQVFVHSAKTAADVLRFPAMNREAFERLVTLENGTGNLESVLARGKGAIALTGHLGNWEFLASFLRHRGFPGSIVARKVYYEPFNRILVRLRQSGLVRTIYHDGPPRAVLAELRANHVVGMSADQDIDRVDGIFVPFFGKPAWTPTAPAKIALASGAAIVPMFLIHWREGYHLFVEEPIWPEWSHSKEEAIERITVAWSEVVERFIRRFPDQWVWMHHRWRTSPEAAVLEKERV